MENIIENVESQRMSQTGFMHLWEERTEQAQMRGDKEYNIRHVLDLECTIILATDYELRIGPDGEFVNLYFHKHFIGRMLLKNVRAIL